MKKTNRMFALLCACAWITTAFTGCGGGMDMESTKNNTAIRGDSPAMQSPEYYYEAEDGAYDITISGGKGEINVLPDAEEYNTIIENGFLSTAENPLSTFSVDVDTASYSNVRRMLLDGISVNPDAVRIEEMINYFSYDYPDPVGDDPFSVNTEQFTCPWKTDNTLLLVGLQADHIDLSARKPMNLVFLIDVSGSMYSPDKLPLVQDAFAMLTENLNENDRISIVTYAGSEAVVLQGCAGNNYTTITDSIYSLEAGGSTAGAAGIQCAYALAEDYFIEDGNNRVILATDGDLNVGLSTEEELTELIEEKRESGVNLSVLGFGTGNLKDDRLEALADHGNGNYAYIDSMLEARKVLVQEMGGTLYTVAKDVKIQMEFDPAFVESYRLIGYENRALANEDFDNDKVDAGEIGAGHSVTALYECVLTEGAKQAAMDDAAEAAFKLNLRYKQPNGDESKLLEYPVALEHTQEQEIPENLAFAAAVAEFGMLLRDSEYAGDSSLWQIRELLKHTDMQNEYRQEFEMLAGMAFNGTDKAGSAPEETQSATFSNKELADMEEVNNAISEWMQSETFQSMGLEERETETRKLLYDLAWYGTESAPYSLIDERSITFSNGIFSFSYTCGVLGGVKIEDFNPMMN